MTPITLKSDKALVETLLKNKEIFLKLNQYRLERAFDAMPRRISKVFRVLPFLLHVNNPAFPGYIESPAVPCGIISFKLTLETIIALNSLFPKAKEIINNKSIMPRHNFIRSLLLMGSIGSIAQNSKSDFDFWVCIHEEHFKLAWMNRFIKKLNLIETWSENKHDVEVHFFPTDIKKARNNIFGESDKESSGSSQAKLLKEEFYRTMILVAGKIPIWWIMPPGVDDKEYDKLKKLIRTNLNPGKDIFFDLGNLYEISYKEFFGSALWQINKAMDSPFKSVLKMGLLESNASDNNDPILLCVEIKKRVFESEGKNLFFDPYSMMFDHVLEFYQGTENKNIIDLLCKCFYIKIGVKANLDTLKNDKLSLKEKVILNYAREWDWNHDKLKDLNSYSEWSFKKVLKLGDEVQTFMAKAYQRLTDQLKEKSLDKLIITETDLTILGRKLFTFYSKKKNKVMGLRKAFDHGFLQDDLTFHVFRDKSRKIMWKLFRGKLTNVAIEKEDMTDKLLIKHNDLTYIITWMVYNKIIDLKTRVYFTPNFTNVQFSDIQRLVKELFAFFSDFTTSTLSNEDLLSNANKKQVFIVLNFYSERTIWDIESVALIYLTSWGELFYEYYIDPKAGMDKVCRCVLEFNFKEWRKLPDHFKIFAPKGPQYRSLLKTARQAIEKTTELTLNLDI